MGDRAAELKQLMEEKMTKEKEDWAADNDCEADGVEVAGAGNLSRPYACMDECPADMPFRCMETMQCHDCTDATLGEKAGMMELVEGECKPVEKDNKKNEDNKKKDDGKKVPFACAATCADPTPFRCHKTQQCHDCTETTLDVFAEFYKPTSVSKTDKDGIETTMDKCNKAKIGDITVDRAAELKQLMEAKMTKEKEDWAADNDCEADGVEVVGAGNLSRPYACMDECPADMPFRCMETMQCHDCTDATLGEKAGMMEL